MKAELFVGRRRELSELRAAAERAAAGTGGLILVTGEPGIGKTRLATQLAEEAAGNGTRVLWGRCWEGEGGPPFWPWVQILRTFARGCDPAHLRRLLGGGASLVARMVPDVADVLGDTADETIEGQQTRFRLFDAVCSMLHAAAQQEPLVLVLDDVHWADAGSLLLLEFAGRDVRDARLLIVATYREEDVRERPELAEPLAAAARHGQHIPLRGLSSEDVARLVKAETGTDPDEGFVRAVLEATGGNPFFVNELVRLAVAEDRTTPDGLAAAVPEAVRGALRRRLARISPGARDALAAASVLGRDFSVVPLSAVTGIDRAELLEILDEAVDRGLVNEAGPGLGMFAFAHALVRETLYDDLGARRRAELHLQSGHALESFYGPRAQAHAAELAHHFVLAVPVASPGPAYRYSVMAAREASAKLAYEEAVRHFGHALELAASNGADTRERCELELDLADAVWHTGDHSGCSEIALRASVLAQDADAPDLIARAALTVGGGTFLEREYSARVVALLEEATRRLPGDDPLCIRALARLGQILGFGEALDRRARERGREYATEALDRAERQGDPDLLVYALISRHFTLDSPLYDPERLAVLAELAEVAQHSRQPMSRLWLNFRVFDFVRLGDWPTAERLLVEGRRVATEIRQPVFLVYASLLWPVVSLVRGRFEEAEQELDVAERDVEILGIEGVSGVAILCRALLHREAGRHSEVRDLFARTRDRRPAGPFNKAALLAISMESLGNDALPHAERMWELRHEWLPEEALALVACAQAWVTTGDRARGAEAYEALVPFAGRMLAMGRPMTPFLGDGSLYLGQLAAMLERYDDAERHLHDALVLYERIGARPWAARARHAHAAMLVARDGVGDGEHALELRDRALAEAREMGMAGLVATLTAHTEDVPETEPETTPRRGSFVHLGDLWSITYAGRTAQVRDMKGFSHLQRLLAHPGREFHALDFAASGSSTSASRAAATEAGLHPDTGDAGELLDADAKAAYRARIEDLREELEEAEAFGDQVRAARAKAEMDAIVGELSRAVGLGGRNRRASSTAERARINVTRTIRAAIDRVREQHPELGAHLDSAVRTGIYCAYQPDPAAAVAWTTER